MRKFSSGVSVPEKVTKQQSGKQFSQWRPTILIFCLLISSDSALSRAELHFCHHWFLSPVQSITRNETLDMKKQCYMTRTWLMSILGGFPPFQNWKDKNKELGIFFFVTAITFTAEFLIFSSETLACQGQRCTAVFIQTQSPVQVIRGGGKHILIPLEIKAIMQYY